MENGKPTVGASAPTLLYKMSPKTMLLSALWSPRCTQASTLPRQHMPLFCFHCWKVFSKSFTLIYKSTGTAKCAIQPCLQHCIVCHMEGSYEHGDRPTRAPTRSLSVSLGETMGTAECLRDPPGCCRVLMS